jgi:O-antigen/teichoic acid export membrane protein
VGIITTPFLIRALGTDRYGLLGLAWVVLGYFTVFDLGLGRAVTKYVAEFLAQDHRKRALDVVWAAVIVQSILGLLGTLVLVGITPVLTTRVLHISPPLQGEASSVFHLLGVALPVVLISGSFSGLLEAVRRFDLVNAVRTPLGVLSLLLSVLGAMAGLSLSAIVGLVLLTRVVALLALIILALRIFPQLRSLSTEFSLIRRLLTYGGWVTVSSVVAPILVYLDRLVVATLMSLGALAYYSAPYDAATKLWIIPASLTTTLFPTFSSLQSTRDRDHLGVLLARAIKLVALVLGPIVVLLTLFAPEILRLWLGIEFSRHSAPALQILSWGVLVNSLAHVPYSLLHGIGRPDLPAKFHIVELPIYAGMSWLLIGRWGISGAAAAWTTRVTLDALLMFGAAFLVCRFPLRTLAVYRVPSTGLALVLLVGLTYGLKHLVTALPLVVQSLFFGALVGLFAWVVWIGVLDAAERGAVSKLVKL